MFNITTIDSALATLANEGVGFLKHGYDEEFVKALPIERRALITWNAKEVKGEFMRWNPGREAESLLPAVWQTVVIELKSSMVCGEPPYVIVVGVVV